MSVLESKEILRRLATEGDLAIVPIINPKQIGNEAVDLRLGAMAAVIRGSSQTSVDPRQYAEAEAKGGHTREQRIHRKLEHISVPFAEPLVLHAGSLTLVPTLEWVRLPADLQGVVTARSSWGREGLGVATAAFIHPCYNGTVTLELTNFGQIPIILYPGLRIAQIAFYRVDDSNPCPDGKSSQFDLSFEATAGNVTDGDEGFIPLPPTT